MRDRICLTGLSGRLGTILYKALGDEFEWLALNRRKKGQVPTVQADISDASSLADVLVGQEVVVHLAAYPFSDNSWSKILPTNLVGMYNLIEAARHANIKRFVFASSLAVLGAHLPAFKLFHKAHGSPSGREKIEFLEGLDSPRPDSLYGVSKIFGEALCRMYTDSYEFSCVCLRLAEVRPDDRPNPEDSFGHAIMCRHADFVAGVRSAITRTRQAGLEIRTLISDDFTENSPGRSGP